MLLPQFGKYIEKSIIRFLQRLHFENATFVAKGICSQFILKLLSPIASRAFTSPKDVRQIILFHPLLQVDFINQQIVRNQFNSSSLQNAELHIVYENENEFTKRESILRELCPKGSSYLFENDTKDVPYSYLLEIMYCNDKFEDTSFSLIRKKSSKFSIKPTCKSTLS